tara:strand:- start:42 stop:494 length:453 start_codon:yes stop_codon:yes gene_type:complete
MEHKFKKISAKKDSPYQHTAVYLYRGFKVENAPYKNSYGCWTASGYDPNGKSVSFGSTNKRGQLAWEIDKYLENLEIVKLNKILTEEVMYYWLGDAINKQARINLFDECFYSPEVLNSVLDHYVSGHDLKEIHNEVWFVLNRSDYFYKKH